MPINEGDNFGKDNFHQNKFGLHSRVLWHFERHQNHCNTLSESNCSKSRRSDISSRSSCGWRTMPNEPSEPHSNDSDILHRKRHAIYNSGPPLQSWEKRVVNEEDEFDQTYTRLVDIIMLPILGDKHLVTEGGVVERMVIVEPKLQEKLKMQLGLTQHGLKRACIIPMRIRLFMVRL